MENIGRRMSPFLNPNFANLYSYCEYVDACITHKEVPGHIQLSLIDHRYFYTINGKGTYACGVAREAVTSQLHRYGMSKVGFMDSLESLDQFISNKSVVGFFIEQAVLQTIQSRGLMTIKEISNSMDKITFNDFPVYNTSKPRVLYVPTTYNYPGIDGIIVWLDHQKMEAKLYPFQVTIAKSHADSEKMFFNNWEKWTNRLRGFKVTVHFLWITDKEPLVEDVEEATVKLRSRIMLKNPTYTLQYLPLETVNKDIWYLYEKAQSNWEMRDLKKLKVLENKVPEMSKEQDVEEQ